MLYTKEKIEKLQERWTTPKGKKLVQTIKKSRCYLSPVLFREKIHNLPGINDPEVEEGIDLRGIHLSGFDFRTTVQEEDEGFIEDIAILNNIHFEGAVLKHCNFSDGKIHDCYFEGADLSYADFRNSSLNACSFQESDCQGIHLQSSKVTKCSFVDTNIKDLSISGSLIDEKTKWGATLKSEKEGNCHFASIEYKQIKQMYKNSSLHSQADNYHYKEMVAKRKTLPKKNPVRILSYIFGDLLCKYGTSFVRVLMASVIIILICASIYTIEDGLFYNGSPLAKSDFFSSLYFSIVTFTTLGYGDLHAVGALRFVAATQSFLGATLIALFTVIVARILIRD